MSKRSRVLEILSVLANTGTVVGFSALGHAGDEATASYVVVWTRGWNGEVSERRYTFAEAEAFCDGIAACQDHAAYVRDRAQSYRLDTDLDQAGHA